MESNSAENPDGGKGGGSGGGGDIRQLGLPSGNSNEDRDIFKANSKYTLDRSFQLSHGIIITATKKT